MTLVLVWSATKSSAQRPDEGAQRGSSTATRSLATQVESPEITFRQRGFSLPLAEARKPINPSLHNDLRAVSFLNESPGREDNVQGAPGSDLVAFPGLIHVAQGIPAQQGAAGGSVRLAAPSNGQPGEANTLTELQTAAPKHLHGAASPPPRHWLPPAPDQFGAGNPQPLPIDRGELPMVHQPKVLDHASPEPSPMEWLPPGEIIVSGEGVLPGVNVSSPSRHAGRRYAADYWTPWSSIQDRLPKSGPLRWMADFHWRHRGRADSVTCDLGIGHERVMYAPQIVDTPISTANISMWLQADRGINVMDRSTYVWSPRSIGPGYDPDVNMLDSRLRMELGGRRFMAITEFTMRSLDPTLAPNTTGFGDMIVGAKTLMLDGKRLKVATVFRSYLPTGPSTRGLGVGHTALEPGAAARYCLSPKTYVFGDLKYWTPLGEDPSYGGDILICGAALSTVFSESDVYAILPTFEVRTLSFLFGGQSVPTGVGNPVPQTVQAIDGRTAVEIYPGARIVIGPSGDLGLLELNVTTGITVAEDQWFDTRFQIGVRWNY